MAGEPIGGSGLMAGFRLETERLILREWRDDDFGALHALCTDAKVMATIGPLHDEQRTRDMLARLQMRQARDGCTFWAMERKEDERVVGYCGVGRGTVPQLETELEVGWRLAADCWGQSYAREAAEATLAWIAANHPGEPVWAITAVSNGRSRGLMERLGMRYRPELDFDHPKVEFDHLKPHVTYWLEQAA
jgi:RimJ/RimL family protein N-acetyltransferase